MQKSWASQLVSLGDFLLLPSRTRLSEPFYQHPIFNEGTCEIPAFHLPVRKWVPRARTEHSNMKEHGHL